MSTATPTNSASPTATTTSTSTITPTGTATFTATNTSLPTITASSTPLPSNTPTATSTPLPTNTPIASVVPTATMTPSATTTPYTTILFSDGFDRLDDGIVGSGWVEVEANGAQVGIQGNRMCFLDTSDVVNRPIALVTFQQVSSGELTWNFDFDWARINKEGTYRLFMQLGKSVLMDNNNQSNGVGVNLVWTQLNNIHQTLGYQQQGVDTALLVMSGPTSVSVLVNLDNKTYDVSVNGSIVQTGIVFDNDVDIDTVRFFTDVLNDFYFSGRCFDNLSLEAISSDTPTATSTPNPPNTSTPTDTLIPTNTPSPTAPNTSTPTPLPTDTPTTTVSPQITSTLTPTNTFTPTGTATFTATPTNTATPTPTLTPIYEIYQMLEIDFIGPASIGMGSPNPFLIELEELKGKEQLTGYTVFSLIKY